MRIFRLLYLIVIISALLNVVLAMSDQGEPKTFKTERGKCLTFNRVSHGRRRARRIRLEKCSPRNSDPDQWIYIRKINKHEGVFYNFAGNQIIAYNSRRNKFQIVARELLYRGETTGLHQHSQVTRLRGKLERFWKRHERCKRKRHRCTMRKKHRILKRIRRLVMESESDQILTQHEAKWIVERPRIKIRHKRSRNSKIESLFFNLQDKLYPNGYYQILVNLNGTIQKAYPEKFI